MSLLKANQIFESSLSIIMLFLFVSATPSWTQEFALKQLNESPRHHEWIEVPSGDGRHVRSFIVYPEKKEKALAVIVIHENMGLTDWVRSFADQLASRGYLVIAPDLLSGFDSTHQRTSDFESGDAARDAIYQLKQEQITIDLLAVRNYISKVPSANGKTVVIGFCWGGAQTFHFAANCAGLSAALVFYGTAPTEDQIEKISAPVYGFYGENDERINATIPETEKLMKKHSKAYQYKIYPGAGHAFMRLGDDPQGLKKNKEARDQSWKRLEQILSGIRP